MKSFINWLESAGLVGGDPTNANLAGARSKTAYKEPEFREPISTKSPECKYYGDCGRDKKAKRAKPVEV